MRQVTILLMMIVLGTVASYAKKPIIHKDRDKLRFGYGEVNEEKIGTLNQETGEIEIREIWITCFGAGKIKCRSGEDYSIPELTPVKSYTEAETLRAQELIDEGDGQIEGGKGEGVVSRTITFVNTVTGERYQRRFTYYWCTADNGHVLSWLEVSDPFSIQ